MFTSAKVVAGTLSALGPVPGPQDTHCQVAGRFLFCGGRSKSGREKLPVIQGGPWGHEG